MAPNLRYGAVLANSPRNFNHKLEIETHPYDRSRLRFAMTNAGLSLRAEVFVNLALFGVHQPIYLIKLNCSYIGHASPMVLLLRDADSNATHEQAPISSHYFPLAFRKIQYPALDLQSVITSMGDQWASRGWHDIIIGEEKTVLGVFGPTSLTKPFCFLRQQEEWYQLSKFQLLTRIGGLLSPIILSPATRPPSALQPGQACMFIMTVRSDTKPLRHEPKSERDTHYLMILKWKSRGLICGIWSSPEDNPDFYDSIGEDLSGPFPTRAPGATPATEIQVLVSTRLDKHTGVSYAISIRRRVLKIAPPESRIVKDPDAPSFFSPRHINDLVEVTFEPHDRGSVRSWEMLIQQNSEFEMDQAAHLMPYNRVRDYVDSLATTCNSDPATHIRPSDIDMDEGYDFRWCLEEESPSAHLESHDLTVGIGAGLAGPLFIPHTSGTLLEGATSLKPFNQTLVHEFRIFGMEEP